jgi:ATP-binding cassette, subfamily B, bacterial MsbA
MKWSLDPGLQRLLGLALPHWRRLLLAAACMLGIAGFTALSVYIIKPAMDDIFVNRDTTMLRLMPVVILAVFMFKGGFAWANSYLLEAVGLRVVNALRQQLYDHIQDLPLSFFDRMPTGVLMSRITNDVNEVQGAVTKALTGLIRDSFTVVGLIVVIIYRDWRLASLGVVVLPVAFYPLFVFGSKLRKLAKRTQETRGLISVLLHEGISGSRIVKAFGMEGYEKDRFAQQLQKDLDYGLKTAWIDALSSPLMEFIGAIGIAAIVFYGGLKVIQGESTPGTFFSFLGGLLALYQPVKGLSKVNSQIQKALAAIHRVYEILDTPTDLVEKADAGELPRISREVRFERVSFAYQEELVLRDVDLQVRAGEVIALVGTSGGGKTTLVNLIPRFYDVTTGAVSIDGVDVRDVTFKSLRGQIGMVTQQSFLFNDTVRNNIAYGDVSQDDQAIVEAARAAYAYDFIVQLPQGMDTVIGEQGVRLSGGQRQRICIARALLKNAPILILDEATSSLDSESELEVQRALENLMRGRTTFVIAHRLSTVQSADRILVIVGGRIMEQGSHADLLARNGEYRRLYDIQFQQC